jgi:hypothetical protein
VFWGAGTPDTQYQEGLTSLWIPLWKVPFPLRSPRTWFAGPFADLIAHIGLEREAGSRARGRRLGSALVHRLAKNTRLNSREAGRASESAWNLMWGPGAA